MGIKLLGHRVHPMLIGMPLGLLSGAVIFDVLWILTASERWSNVSFPMIALGIISGIVVAPFGTLDWLDIPSKTRAKRVGLLHGLLAFVSLVLFAVSWWLRYENPGRPGWIALGMALLGGVVLGVAGWMGGELVERMGIAVDTGAHPNSPSSLSDMRASEFAPSQSSAASSPANRQQASSSQPESSS